MHKLDNKDRRILFELSQNSRISNKQLSREVKLSEPSTINRINNLLKKGIIEYAHIITNNAKLGYFHYKIFFRTLSMDENTENRFIKTIKENNNVIWSVSTRGNYDYIVSVLVKDIHEFSKIYKDITYKFADKILGRNVCVVEAAKVYSRGYLLNQRSKEYRYGTKVDSINLDEDDIKILRLITTDARISAVVVARELNVSSDKIIYRIKRMVNSRFLQGFGIKINHKLLGIKKYIITFEFQNFTNQKYNILREIVIKNGSLQFFIFIIGNHDLEIELEINNSKQLDNLFKEIRNNFTNELRKYEILEITEEHKLNYFPF